MNRAYIDALYRVHLDMHTPEWDSEILSEFDAEQIVRTIAASGCRGMVGFAKDTYGNAYYPTQFGHVHACLKGRDVMGELIAACRRHEVAFAAYYCAILDNRAAAEHPEWCMRDPEGRPVSDCVTAADQARWHYVCHNSGFAELAEEMIEEIGQNYDVDGFHIDMFNMDFGGLTCYCDTCRKLFFDETGLEMPTKASWDETWFQLLDFRYRSVERYMLRLREAVKRVAPDCPVIMNYHGSPGFDWRVGQKPVRHSLPSDLSTGETYTPMLGDMYPGLETRFLRGLVPGKPVDLVSWRMNRITDFTTKPKAQLRWELFSSLTLGTTVMLIDQPFANGWLDEYPYGTLKEIFAEIESKRTSFAGEPQRHAAIYYSWKTRDAYGRSDQARFQLPIMGAYKALIESHIDVAFLFDEDVSAASLAQYPVIVLPNVAILSEEEAALFTEYVRNGGTLLASFDTSLYDEKGCKLPNFRLAEVFGVDYEGTHDCDASYIRNTGLPLGKDIDPACYILTEGPVHRVTPATALPFGDLHDSFHKKQFPGRFYSHSMHPPHERLMDATYLNKHGEGTCVYFSFPCDAAYAGKHELPEHRLLLRNAVLAAGHKPLVRVAAPLIVETNILREGKRVYVHLLAYSPIRQANTLPDLNRPIRPSLRMEEAPLFRAAIEVGQSFEGVQAANPRTEVVVKGQTITALIEDVHEVIQFDLKP